jgi:hypothetical protein
MTKFEKKGIGTFFRKDLDTLQSITIPIYQIDISLQLH